MEVESCSSVDCEFRIVERTEWIPVYHLDSMESAKSRALRWRVQLERADNEVLFTRCVVKRDRVDTEGDLWASVWMVAGVSVRESTLAQGVLAELEQHTREIDESFELATLDPSALGRTNGRS